MRQVLALRNTSTTKLIAAAILAPRNKRTMQVLASRNATTKLIVASILALQNKQVLASQNATSTKLILAEHIPAEQRSLQCAMTHRLCDSKSPSTNSYTDSSSCHWIQMKKKINTNAKKTGKEGNRDLLPTRRACKITIRRKSTNRVIPLASSP